MPSRDRISRRRPHEPMGPIITGSERVRLALFFGVAAVITGTLLWLDRSSKVVTRDEPEFEVRFEQDRIESIDMAVRPWQPEIEAWNLLIDESTAPLRAAPSLEALQAHAWMLRNRPHVHFRFDRDPNGSYRRISVAELAKPDLGPQHRAKPVEIVGDLLDAEIIDASAFYGFDRTKMPDAATMWRGVIVASGQPVRFLLVGDGVRGGSMPEVGVRTKILGTFHQVIDEQIEVGQSAVTMPLILGTRLVPAIPLIEAGPLLPETVESVKQAELNDVKRLPQQEATFYRVLGHVLGRSEEFGQGNDQWPLLRGREPLTKPERFRLAPVRIEGFVTYLNAESFGYEDAHPDDAPIRGFWHAVVSTAEPNIDAPISLVIPDVYLPDELRQWASLPRAERALAPMPSISVPGLYYRVHSFTSRGNPAEGQARGRPTNFPLVIAGAIPKVDRKAIQRMDDRSFMLGFIAVGAFIALSLSWLLWRDRRRSVALEAELRSARLERRRRGAPPPAPMRDPGSSGPKAPPR